MTELPVSGWAPGVAEAPKAAKPYVEFRSVLKTYGAATVLKDFSLEVPKGQRLALIGPSGSARRPSCASS